MVMLDHQMLCILLAFVIPLVWRIELLELGTLILSRPSYNSFSVRFLCESSLSGYSENPS